ncbi:MAG TPA: hypothetical protein VMF51_20640 [Nocardioides sp.]|uniref:hypothetical protein n=1 Tax=Nocardioides sp. TaxID=35761 RepID=UPI002BA3D850|nr:hypothetical protein [Nocardioides sp.]HTW17548.1 hypothetical protein [Nocardioides sp.]
MIDRSTNAPTTPGSPAGPAGPAGTTAPTSTPAGYPTPAPPREIATPATSPSTVLRWAHMVPRTPGTPGTVSGHAAPTLGIARAAAAAPPMPGGVPVPGLLARAERGGEPLRRTPAGPASTPTARSAVSPATTPVPSAAGPWTTATPTDAPTGPPVPAVGRLTPSGAGPAASPTASPGSSSSAGDGGRISRMTVAPPRISITPGRSDGAPAPAVPAVATSSAPTGATPASAQPGAARSLVESTAHLFSSVPEGVVRRLLDEGGTPMSGHQHESWSSEGPAPSTPGTVVRRWATPSGGSSATTLTGPGPSETSEALQPGGALDALVDAVVERVEQRVIDELERRGRRQDWAAF